MPAVNQRLLRAAAIRQLQQAAGQQQSGRGVQMGNVGAGRADRAGQVARAQRNTQAGQAGPVDWDALGAQRRELRGEKPKAPPGPGGIKGLAGDIFANPVTRVALKPFELLDYGRRAVISGAKELADKGGPPGTRLFGTVTDESSWSDFVSQLKDPTFGFGDITGDATGNKWADRGIGFAGDVALDPLTWVTLGSNKVPGSLGRIKLSAEAAEKGMAREVIEAAGTRGGRGVRKVSEEAARELGVPERGLRYGTHANSVRIPMTGFLDDVLGGALDATRGRFVDTPVARAARRMGAGRSEELRGAVERIATGKPDAAEAAAHWGNLQWRDAEARLAEGTFQKEARQVGREAGDDPNITHAVEAMDLSDPRAKRMADMYSDLYDYQVGGNPERPQYAGQGVSLGPKREGYVNKVLTQDGIEAFGHESSSFVPQQTGGGLSARGPQFGRAIKPGETYTIMGKVFEPITGTIKEANDWSMRELGIKLYEDSPGKLAAHALQDVRHAVGEAAHLEALKRTGNRFSLTDPIASRIDADATQIASKQAAEGHLQELEPLVRALTQRPDTRLDEAQQGLRAFDRGAGRAKRSAYGDAYGAANQAQSLYGEAAAGMAENSALRDRLQAQLGTAQQAEGAAQRPVDQLAALANSGLQGPQMLEQFPLVQKQLTALQEQYDKLVQIAQAAPDQRTAGQAVLRARQTQRDIEELFRRYPVPVEGAPLPEAAPFEEALQQATGARQGIEQQLGPVEAQHAAQVAALEGQVPENMTRVYRGEALAPDPGVGLPSWMEGNPELAARDSVQGRWFTTSRDAAMTYPMNRDPGVGNRLKFTDLPNDVYEQLRGLSGQSDAVKALSKDAREVILPDELMAGAREGLQPPNVDQMVAQQVQPVLDRLTEGRKAFEDFELTQQLDALELGAQRTENTAALEAKLATLPEHVRNEVREFVAASRDPVEMGKFLGDIHSGGLNDQIVRLANDGFQKLSTDRLIGRDVYVTDTMHKMMTEWNRVMAEDPSGFGKIVRAYTQFFKSWATATPGFQVRNGMSATYMNMSEGVSFREMGQGNLIWSVYRKNPTKDWVSMLPPELQEIAPKVVKAVYASGAGGRYTAAELSQRAFSEGSKADTLVHFLSGGRITEGTRALGEQVEGRVRAGLAVHSIKEGDSMLDAAARIKRVHFDYSEVNALDERLRNIIPFWTFMSRNLPLQVQQMWLKPRTYAQFNSLMRNVNDDPEGTGFMPDWMRGAGGTLIGANTAIVPDVGATQMEDMVQTFTDPARMATKLSPPVKSLIEQMTNQDLFYGNQFKKNDYQKPGWELTAVMPLLNALNLTENTREGPVLQRKHMELLRDNIPFLGTANRLGSTTADREGKGLQSWLNWLGVPVRSIAPDARAKAVLNERNRMRYDDPVRAKLEALRQYGGAA